MKKFFLIAALVLAVVSSLVAGTMAAYTQTLDINSAEVQTKEFGISAGKSKTFSESIKLAPGDSVSYRVKINNDGEVLTRIRVSSELAAVDGNGNTQLKLSTGWGWYGAKEVEDGVYELLLETESSAECTLTVAWPYDGDNETDTEMMKNNAASQLVVHINGTQVNANEVTQAGQATDAVNPGN